MIQRDYLVVGAGPAGASACQGIRQYDKKGAITLVGTEGTAPYHRPPLSRKYLSDKKFDAKKLPLLDPSWFEKQKIELRLQSPAIAFNAERHIAVLANGETIEFKKALLAPGSRPRRPPVAGANLGNVFYLRSLRDAAAIRETVSLHKDVVVVGGGFIAVEISASLASIGKQVSLVNRDPLIWSHRVDEETARWLTGTLDRQGVKLMLQQDLKGFEGKTVLRNVATKGGERFPASLAIVAVGAELNLELVHSTPLHSPNGTPVNDYLETDEKGIYAAGDIALFPDRIFGGARRVEHWDNAIRSGETAGWNMTGRKRQKFDYLPWCDTQIFDLHLEFVGDFSRPISTVEIEGARDKRKFVIRYSELGKLRGALLCNQEPGRAQAVAREIREAHKA